MVTSTVNILCFIGGVVINCGPATMVSRHIFIVHFCSDITSIFTLTMHIVISHL